ncbi:hypothetical protein [Pontibacillus salipaludis]|uniref:hypothetical protein n=1 Tax=Pontibacillus salipaludis TaxID=1697394 RepID=UPI0031E523D4
MGKKTERIEKKLNKIEKDLKEAKQQLQSLKKNEQTSSDKSTLSVIPYFSYTIKIPKHNEDHTVHIFGSFIIKNIGSASLKKPYICIKFSDITKVSLAAKISSEDHIDQEFSPVPTQTWNFISKDLEKRVESDGEYWLTPINVGDIPPQKNLSFANFHAWLDCSEFEGTLKMEGYVYGEGAESGIPSLNKINVSL